MRILLAEDDIAIASGLSYSLTTEGYEVTVAHTAAAAAAAIRREGFGLCLLDLSLPDGNGYELCALAKRRPDSPVIFLTALDDESNVVKGLDLGADDYVSKPFRLRELLSRIRSVLRRYGRPEAQNRLPLGGGVTLQMQEGRVFKNGGEVPLTALEYRLLLTFANNPGQLLSRVQLLESIWDAAGDFVNDNTLTVYIKRLREKLEDDPANPALLRTVRGLGYRLEQFAE